MQIHFLGTGTAFHTDGRCSQSIRIHPPGSAPFLVDAGPTVMAALTRDRIGTDDLDRLFVTHLHGDHFAGWPFLLLNLQMIDRRTRPFEIYGPPGTRDCLERLTELCYGNLLGADQRGFPVRYREFDVVNAVHRDEHGMRLETYPMQHHPSSIAYCFEVGGMRVGISGDTGWCDSLEELARACDLLILECTTCRTDLAVHVSLNELRQRRQRLGAGVIYLVHLTDEVAAELAADPIAGVISCYDGMTVEPG